MKIAVIGAGNLGGAIAEKLRENPELNVLTVRREGTPTLDDVEGCDAYVIALKPDVFRENMKRIGKIVSESPVISFAAGVKIDEMREYIKNPMRAMTNIEVSMIACYPERCAEVLSDMSLNVEMIVCDKESEIDILTSYLGSAPAIIAYLIHSFILSAVKEGIEYEVAVKVACTVFKDSGELYRKYGLDGIVRKIATPSGTTIEGISTLIAEGVMKSINESFSAASRRARSL